MKILVINAGSSSIKYQMFEMPAEKVVAKGLLEKIGEETSKLTHTTDSKEHKIETKAADHSAGMKLILDTLVAPQTGVIKDISEINAVGHRVVHGGEEFTASCIINEHVIGSIERFADLAPLHNPPNLTGIKAAQKALPKVPQVACFDTAFHTTLPQTAFIYALPYDIYEKYRVRKYGFHGTSHKYITQRAAVMLGKKLEDINIITCHLGNGCSMAAVKNGKSIDTSMGLTPLEGLVMGTRTGDFDPAILFYLADKGYSVDDLNTMCNKKSGLLGISGISNDMRNLREQAEKGDKRAELAFDIFCYRIKKYIGAYTAVVGRLDAIVFTGGIGENTPIVRSQTCGDLEQIGVDIDEAANTAKSRSERTISSSASKVKVFVIPTNEELAIAQDTFSLAK
ncbi:MAG: acetate kinase [Planctomycetes bacterium GWF2_42_9]|nr:MAG: acetate kinase [Planctomycetes bacterium GWF2_42_9]HAL46000.1 acetate kinase [Phycisphaerales bacterium]